MLGQLKQVCNHPEPSSPPAGRSRGAPGSSSGSSSCWRTIPADDKALVFTQYPGFGRLAPHLGSRLGRDVGFFHGRLSARARDELLARFDRVDGPSLLVVSLRPAAAGSTSRRRTT